MSVDDSRVEKAAEALGDWFERPATFCMNLAEKTLEASGFPADLAAAEKEIERLRDFLNKDRQEWVDEVLGQAEPALRSYERRAQVAEAGLKQAREALMDIMRLPDEPVNGLPSPKMIAKDCLDRLAALSSSGGEK